MCFDAISLQQSLKSEMLIPLQAILSYRIVLAILKFFHMKLIILSRSINKCVGILLGIALNLQIAFSKMTIFSTLTLPIHVHGNSCHLLISSSIYVLYDYNFVSLKQKVSSKNAACLTVGGQVEECKSIHICCPAQNFSTNGQKLQHKSRYTEHDRTESGK